MTEYVAILGRQPELSAAELIAVTPRFGGAVLPYSRSAALAQGASEPMAWFARLGGTVKLGRVLLRVPSVRALHNAHIADLAAAVPAAGKALFGCSAYDLTSTDRRAVPSLVLALKQHLRAAGRSARYIAGNDGVVPSATVAKGGLLQRGAEFLLVGGEREVLVARTVAVQPFEAFTERDYGRPGRNARAGMLPPKLARIMLNLAGVIEGATVLDPFCGSGTVLQEALLLGARSALGFDIAPRAVEESRANLAWLQEHHGQLPGTARIRQGSSVDVAQMVPPYSVDAVVTEPHLGPPLTGSESPGQIQTTQKKLCELYTRTFENLSHVLTPRGTVVFLLPVFTARGHISFLPVLDDLLRQGFSLMQPLPPAFMTHYQRDLSYRHTLVYRRPGQRVGREILLLRRALSPLPKPW